MALRSIGGFTLVEVLVALFVLAVGIVGASATQATALRTRHQSALTSAAAQLAASLAERMRANPVVMAGADGANPYLQLRYDAAGSGALPAPEPCYGQALCTPVQMAQLDVFETAEAVRTGFPRGRIVVCRDAGLDAAAVAWDCADGAGAPLVVKLGWGGNDGSAAPALAMVVQ